HYSSVLIESILLLEKNTASEKMYAHVGKHHFEILVIDTNGLKLFNIFEYQTKEDFIYYILFTAEQLQLNPEEFELILLGHIDEGDELYDIAYTYVRHIYVHKPSSNYELDAGIDTDIHNNFVLLNSI
ncbi:MAG: DUF3822 family protein, partial [Bacteroidia bacterium]|nr:DUF3822 family protein [Bacteroidia bacterium]